MATVSKGKNIINIIKSIAGSDILEIDGFPQNIRADMEFEGKNVLEIAVESYIKVGLDFHNYEGRDMKYFFKELSSTVSPEVWKSLTDKILETLIAPIFREKMFDVIPDFEGFVDENAIHVRAFIFVQLYGRNLSKIYDVDWSLFRSYIGCMNLQSLLEKILEEYWDEDEEDEGCDGYALLTYFKNCVGMF